MNVETQADAARRPAVHSLAELIDAVLAAEMGPEPAELVAPSVFWLHHGTRLAGADSTSVNQYVLVRVGRSFGACAFEPGEVDAEVCRDASGASLDTLIRDGVQAVRIAALDAYLAETQPHLGSPGADPLTLPAGPPELRARARDSAVADLVDISVGARVALIGVVNPLVAAIRERGGVCLPCDLNLRSTQWGDPVTDDMEDVLRSADTVVATGMTVGNGSFDRLLLSCTQRRCPLIVFAQTGSAVVRAFLGAGVTALSAEPFPFSQFSSEPTALYRYRVGDGVPA